MSEAVTQPLKQVLGIDRPVIGAPMAGVAGGELAAAVSRAGGLGMVGDGYGRPGELEEQMGLTGDARVGIGVITWNMAPGAISRILEYSPVAVWLSFGDPAPHIAEIRDAGAVAICQVANVGEAAEAAQAGAQVIVAQGSESGGHGRPGRSLFALLPAVVDTIAPIPVVAAGGISDLRGYRAVTELGGCGVALGTALYASEEAIDTAAAKQRLVDHGGDDTVRSVIYDIVRGPNWPEGYNGRSLRSALTDQWLGREAELLADPDAEIDRYQQAVADQDMSIRVVWAGEGIDAITAVEPAAAIVGRFPQI